MEKWTSIDMKKEGQGKEEKKKERNERRKKRHDERIQEGKNSLVLSKESKRIAD